MAIKRLDNLTAEPWNRQPGETDYQFAAFCAYRDADPPMSAAEAGKTVNMPRATAEKICTARRWTERRDAWEIHESELMTAEIERGRAKMRKRQIDHLRKVEGLSEKMLMVLGNLIENMDKAKPREVAEILGQFTNILDTYQTREHIAYGTGQETQHAKQETVVFLDDS